MSHRALSVLVLALLATGCALGPGGSSSQPTQDPTATASPTTSSTLPPPTPQPPTAAPSANPSQTPATAFYLRSWYSQSLPPQNTFTWLAPVTISDGVYINGNVAVPAIYPGPLLILPVSRPITDAGIQTIVQDAHDLGLLEGSGDFTAGSAMPGAKLAQLDLVVDGVTHHLVGDPSLSVLCDRGRCTADPGTPQAFTAFWNELGMIDLSMPDQLGAQTQYAPERVALLLTDPGDISAMSPAPTLVAWPLDTPLAQASCVTLAGDDLATMLPMLEASNQLTMFSEGSTVRQPLSRVLVPGEPSPCDTLGQ